MSKKSGVLAVFAAPPRVTKFVEIWCFAKSAHTDFDTFENANTQNLHTSKNTFLLVSLYPQNTKLHKFDTFAKNAKTRNSDFYFFVFFGVLGRKFDVFDKIGGGQNPYFNFPKNPKNRFFGQAGKHPIFSLFSKPEQMYGKVKKPGFWSKFEVLGPFLTISHFFVKNVNFSTKNLHFSFSGRQTAYCILYNTQKSWKIAKNLKKCRGGCRLRIRCAKMCKFHANLMFFRKGWKPRAAGNHFYVWNYSNFGRGAAKTAETRRVIFVQNVKFGVPKVTFCQNWGFHELQKWQKRGGSEKHEKPRKNSDFGTVRFVSFGGVEKVLFLEGLKSWNCRHAKNRPGCEKLACQLYKSATQKCVTLCCDFTEI